MGFICEFQKIVVSFADDSRKVVKVGVNFSEDPKSIDDRVIE